MDSDVIVSIIEILFPFKLIENEYIELSYTRPYHTREHGKKYRYAFHFTSINELLKFLDEKYSPDVNYSIHCTTKYLNNLNLLHKRTKKDVVFRMKAAILDVDAVKHEKITQLQADILLQDVIKKFPSFLKDAVVLGSYTGGGGQIVIVFDKVLERNEITIAMEFLKCVLEGIDNIDSQSFNPAQGQRLIGTFNPKYSVNTKILFKNEEVVPFSFDKIRAWYESIVKVKENSVNYKKTGKFNNFDEILAEIHRNIRFSDIYNEQGYPKSGYTMYHCPFHPPDRNPSFSVLHLPELDIITDFHSGEAYDVIKFLMAYEELSFMDVVKRLSQMLGISLNTDEGFDIEDYIKNIMRVNNVFRYTVDGDIYFEFKVLNVDNEPITITAPADVLLSLNSVRKLFMKKALIELSPLKAPQWSEVAKVLVERAVKDEEGEREPKEQIEDEKLHAFKVTVDNLGGTVDFEEFYRGHKAKYYAGDTIFVSLPGIYKFLHKFSQFESLNYSKIASLLRAIGAKRMELNIEGKRMRVWQLPEGDWRRPAEGTPTQLELEDEHS